MSNTIFKLIQINNLKLLLAAQLRKDIRDFSEKSKHIQSIELNQVNNLIIYDLFSSCESDMSIFVPIIMWTKFYLFFYGYTYDRSVFIDK